MGTILVTGGHGFIGRHVGRVAAGQGHHVIGLGHGDWGDDKWANWGFSSWREDEVTVETLKDVVDGHPQMVIHCAGSGSVGSSFEDPIRDFQRTVLTTLEVVEYLRSCTPGTALVYPSSAAVYGQAETLPIAEAAPMAPISPYGAHKVLAEDLCRAYGRVYDLRVAIVRLFSAYGIELRKQLLWDACRKSLSADVVFAGTGRETRDWVHVEDAARLLLIAGDHAGPDAPTVNGATGDEVETRSILLALFQALGTTQEPRFTGELRPGDPERYAGDPSRARAWGWTPVEHWQDGVRTYADWFLESTT